MKNSLSQNISAILLTALLLASCSGEQALPPIPETESSVPIIISESIQNPVMQMPICYLHPVHLADGTEIRAELPYDTPGHIKEFRTDIDRSGTDDIIIAYRKDHGTGVYTEEVKIFCGESGDEITVPIVTTVLNEHISIDPGDDGWVITIDGIDYPVKQSQFSSTNGESRNPFRATPLYQVQQRFFVENETLYTEILLACDEYLMKFASEAIFIEWKYEGANTLIPESIVIHDRRPQD